MASSRKDLYFGAGLALLAVVIWSGNFIAARGVIKQMPPIALNFFRWLTATIFLFPFAAKKLHVEWHAMKGSGWHFFWTALAGVTLFNTFVYVGARYTSAINLALIGTTTSPIIAIALARLFLKERIGWMKAAGMGLCIAGVLFLLSRGNVNHLVSLHFSTGDGWILLAALTFAVYNTLAKKKPRGLTPLPYLFIVFLVGTLLLLPAYFIEKMHSEPVHWNAGLLLIILYLGVGASVISFLCWNIAIGKLGAGRTALFGNLIPVFSSIEAALILGEQFTGYHVVSMLLVFAGIVMANWSIIRN
jgi:drug/metabolite transporter (DMT)-like permease